MARKIKDIDCTYTYDTEDEYFNYWNTWKGSIFLYDDNYFEGIVIELRYSNPRFISGFIIDGKIITFDKFSSDLCDTYEFCAEETDEIFEVDKRFNPIYKLADKRFIGKYVDLMSESEINNNVNIIQPENKENVAPINSDLKGVLVAPLTGKPMGKCIISLYDHSLPQCKRVFLDNEPSKFYISNLKLCNEEYLDEKISCFKREVLENKAGMLPQSKLKFGDDNARQIEINQFNNYLYQNILETRQGNDNTLVKRLKKEKRNKTDM